MALVLIASTLIYLVASIELLANYKYWKSAGDRFSYDYSGNSRHASLFENYIVTDRGLVASPFYYPSLMSYGFYSTNQYVFSFWMSNKAQASKFWIVNYHMLGIFNVYYDISSSGVTIGFKLDQFARDATLKFTTNLFSGWNLHTFRMFTNPASPGIVNIELYLNLIQIGTQSLDTEVSYIQTKSINLGSQDHRKGLILYEMWIHTGFLTISELNHLISISTICPTTPSTICLPDYDNEYNIQGEVCPIICTNSSLSCDSDLNCILKYKSECGYGLYDIESSSCIFYCPENSCNLPRTITSYNITIGLFDYGCKAGYKKVENPPGCISVHCLSYHAVGYKYVCDTTELGYSTDTSGGCCICSEGYIMFETYMGTSACAPVINKCKEYQSDNVGLICKSCLTGFYLKENKIECLPLNCLLYNLEGGKYVCSECSAGYELDSDGKCNLCELNYDKVLDDPFTCVARIEQCSSYQHFGGQYICEKCSLGYKLGPSGICDECDMNYSRVDSESILCKPDIPNCKDYQIIEESLRCKECKEGYKLDFKYECTLCDVKYIHLPQDNSICIRQVAYCSEYGLYQSIWKCNQCELGYEIDDEMDCKNCSKGYILSTSSKSECILKSETNDHQSDSDSYDQNEEEAISESQKQRGEVIESSNSIAAITILATTAVASVVCMNPTTIILSINTIQLLSLIQYFNINLPLEIKKQQSSTAKYIKKINILSYINIKDEALNNSTTSFISLAIYHFLILFVIMILNIIIYYISRYSKGKIKEIGNKILKVFKYTIYIQVYMITYLDISYYAISKLVDLKEDSSLNILDYDLAVMFTVNIMQTFCAISPFFLASILKSIKLDLDIEENIETYGYLIKIYKDSLIAQYYHVFFLIRRLCIAAAIHLLHDYPYIQISISSISCFIVLIHITLTRPFKDRVFNICMILVEVCVTVCYSASGFLLFSSINREMIMWIILGGIYLSYFVHSALGYYKIFAALYPFIRAYLNRRALNKDIIRPTAI